MVETTFKNLVVTRTLNSPVDAVWRLWTVPEAVRTWWGPANYTAPRCELDLRVGGRYLFCMRAPDAAGGQEFFSVGVYKKIVKHIRLEFTQSFSNEHGNILPARDFGMPNLPDEVHTVVEFEPDGPDRTKLTVTQFEQPNDQSLDYAVTGWNESIDKMSDALLTDNDQELLVSPAAAQQIAERPQRSRRPGRSVLAVGAGLLATVIGSYGVDVMMSSTGVTPSDGTLPLTGSIGVVLLVLGYRTAFNVVGCYVAGRLAPNRPMAHALTLGGLGTVASIGGALAVTDAAPAWYGWGLTLLALPAAALGGYLAIKARPQKQSRLSR